MNKLESYIFALLFKKKIVTNELISQIKKCQATFIECSVIAFTEVQPRVNQIFCRDLGIWKNATRF